MINRWMEFLRERMNCILYFHSEGKTDAEIAQILNLQDADHVSRIRTNPANQEQEIKEALGTE